jgi:hypothetical protein
LDIATLNYGVITLVPKGKDADSIQVGDGAKTSFWEDQWIGPSYLAKAFPRLFLVSMNMNVTIKEVFDSSVGMLTFRREMVGGLRE